MIDPAWIQAAKIIDNLNIVKKISIFFSKQKLLMTLRFGSWNEWRKNNPDAEIDLSKTNLNKTTLVFRYSRRRGANLRRVNLSEAILSEAVLSEANLSETNLSKAHLSEADLSNANLRGTNLSNAFLSKTNLSYANFIGANLNKADLSEANIIDANFIRANLNGANLSETYSNHSHHVIIYGRNRNNSVDFRGAKLIEANFSKSVLREADFSGANLTQANFSGAVLNDANFIGANLIGANLREANLINTNFTNANITSVNLYGTIREEWVIDGIQCDYFYNDPFNGKEGEFIKRTEHNLKYMLPKDRKFKEGEFEELYKQLPTFEYAFENGFSPIDTFVMDQVVQSINSQRPEIELKLDSFHSRGQPRAVFTVFHKHDVDEAKKQIVYEYEKRIANLEGQNETLNKVISSFINNPQQLIEGNYYVYVAKGDNKMNEKNINIVKGKNNKIGAMGKGQSNFNQTNIENVYVANNNKILKEINKLKNELSKITIDQTKKDAITFQIEILVNQAHSDKKNALIMNNALEAIKNITQGALGSAVGIGIVECCKRIAMMIV